MKQRNNTAGNSGLDNQEVFKELYSLYYENLCKFIYSRFFQNIEETEEIVQSVFVKLWENQEKLSGIHSIKSYLYKSACNMAINYIAHKQVQLKYKNEVYLQLKSIEAGEDLYDSEQKETTIEKLKAYIDEMPEQTKEAFKLKYIEGLKYKEIAEKMKISPKTVETMIYRGLKQLRERIDKNIVSEKRNETV